MRGKQRGGGVPRPVDGPADGAADSADGVAVAVSDVPTKRASARRKKDLSPAPGHSDGNRDESEPLEGPVQGPRSGEQPGQGSEAPPCVHENCQKALAGHRVEHPGGIEWCFAEGDQRYEPGHSEQSIADRMEALYKQVDVFAPLGSQGSDTVRRFLGLANEHKQRGGYHQLKHADTKLRAAWEVVRDLRVRARRAL